MLVGNDFENMTRQPLPSKIKEILAYTDLCPACKADNYQLDMRVKKKAKTKTNCRLLRWSKLGVVLECRRCRLRFSISWKSLLNSLQYHAEKAIIGEDKIKKMNSWLETIKIWIDCNFDVNYFNSQMVGKPSLYESDLMLK